MAWHNWPKAEVPLDPYKVLSQFEVIDPQDGKRVPALEGLEKKRALVILLPQLGEFDSAEMVESTGTTWL